MPNAFINDASPQQLHAITSSPRQNGLHLSGRAWSRRELMFFGGWRDHGLPSELLPTPVESAVVPAGR
jgi:hypothetical protein